MLIIERLLTEKKIRMESIYELTVQIGAFVDRIEDEEDMDEAMNQIDSRAKSMEKIDWIDKKIVQLKMGNPYEETPALVKLQKDIRAILLVTEQEDALIRQKLAKQTEALSAKIREVNNGIKVGAYSKGYYDEEQFSGFDVKK